MMPATSYPASSSKLQNQRVKPETIAILLCTFNGARFLPLQLASFESQTFSDWRLVASDDGSEDSTLALLTEFQRMHGHRRVEIRRGPGRGFVANFLSLLCDPTLTFDYYAFSDQDDIWGGDKLTRALSCLRHSSSLMPAIYCSRTRLIDDNGVEIGLSPLFRKKPHFRNALVQSIAGGNTMVFNEKARSVLMKAGPDVNVPSHDWWAYLATTAVGGMIYYDPTPTVDYRVHPSNVVGSNRSFGSVMRRARMIWKGRFRTWNDQNIQSLDRIRDLMFEENRSALELFSRSRYLGLVPRLWGLLRSGVYRQTLLGNVGLLFAALFRKI
jgi:glycosyltransferase involved in cell wall biosynthesis